VASPINIDRLTANKEPMSAWGAADSYQWQCPVIAKKLGNILLMQFRNDELIHIDDELTCGTVLFLVDAEPPDAVLHILRQMPTSKITDAIRPEHFSRAIQGARAKMEQQSEWPWFYGRGMWAKGKRKQKQQVAADEGGATNGDQMQMVQIRSTLARVQRVRWRAPTLAWRSGLRTASPCLSSPALIRQGLPNWSLSEPS
jgi:hypothetical protein